MVKFILGWAVFEFFFTDLQHSFMIIVSTDDDASLFSI